MPRSAASPLTEPASLASRPTASATSSESLTTLRRSPSRRLRPAAAPPCTMLTKTRPARRGLPGGPEDRAEPRDRQGRLRGRPEQYGLHRVSELRCRHQLRLEGYLTIWTSSSAPAMPCPSAFGATKQISGFPMSRTGNYMPATWPPSWRRCSSAGGATRKSESRIPKNTHEQPKREANQWRQNPSTAPFCWKNWITALSFLPSSVSCISMNKTANVSMKR